VEFGVRFNFSRLVLFCKKQQKANRIILGVYM